MNYEIREMLPQDERRVLEIFQQGIDSRIATFDTELPSTEEWNTSFFSECRWVLENDSNFVIGWCALKPVSKRACFKGVAEVSIYFDQQYLGKGLGTLLLKKLITDSEHHGFWTLQSNIFPENEISIKFHQKNGFRMVGTRKKVGKLHGVWKDLVMLEKRSEIVGL
ncbi:MULTISPECIES: GNAT family N-acetyltransferase [Chryseobacterium]|uniref:Phosphinothricin acetyltransferase n=1 Tax=Chryseobacterium taihuense TaxID=1141221 RepID=A0A1G9NX39_9FLAO|nr:MULTISPECIES: GNAT family N-acetyltransferase [Chryseobacterium]QQV04033.1 N-acetyltransferase [Chryseobacterium sp. FDAARGOS 1104]SDL90545.1 phosphinothricin acetyltransferase [Chryseobacterium taihuense]VFB02610.1 Putative phosphinothricin acetyltransferase YwnH [Chryseobacterium taihuense]